MHSSTLLTMPKTKDWHEALASHEAWQALAVVIPVGWESGVCEVLPEGALPQVALAWIGDPETLAMKAEAAMMVLVNECIVDKA